MRLLACFGALLAVAACSGSGSDASHPSERAFVTVDNHRVFTVTFPADSGGPLLVFWNGGPGAPTTTGLLANGTAPMRLQEEHASVVAGIEENPSSFTSLGTLLYLDAPNTGFSYDMGDSSQDFDMRNDATIFARVIASYVEAHPGSADNGIVFVGESYGGIRAQLVIDMLFTEPQYAELAAHIRAQVLIQPAVVGKFQYDATPKPTSQCVYDTHSNVGCANELIAENFMATASIRRELLGGDLDEVEGFLPASRDGARRQYTPPRTGNDPQLEPALVKEYGALSATDSYFASLGPSSADWIDDTSLGPVAFVRNLARVPTMITNASYDGIIVSPMIATALTAMGQTAMIDDAAFGGERPGAMTVRLATGIAHVRMPSYDAGHMVAATRGRELRADIAAFLAAPTETWFTPE